MTEETTTSPDVAESADEANALGVAEPVIELPDGEEADGEEAAAPEDETEEVERDGKKYRVPKALKDELLMHADYTRKTQEVAELRKAAEAERAQASLASVEHVQAMAALMNVDQQIGQFQNIDWQRMSDEDPVRAQKLFVQFSQLKDSRQQLAGHLQQQEQQRAFEMQQTTAKQIEEGQAALKRDIPNWSPETAQQLTDFAAKEFGFQPQELQKIMDPRQVKVLHLAWLGSQLVKKQQVAAKASNQPAPKPVPHVGGTSAASKDMTRLGTDDWMKARNAQLRKSKGR